MSTDTPAVPIPSGVNTSEYAMSKSVQTVSNIVSVIGTVSAIATPIVSANPNTKWGVLGGFFLAILGQISNLLVALGYTNSRTAVKLNTPPQ